MVESVIRRLWNNFFLGPWHFHRIFTSSVSRTLQAKIHEAEKKHSAELKVAIQENFSLSEVLRNVNPRFKAHQVFSSLQVWNTEHNNGVLLYILFSEHKIEIVTDRAITALNLDTTFRSICANLEWALVNEDYVTGIQQAIDDITELLAQYFPPSSDDINEVSDAIEFLK